MTTDKELETQDESIAKARKLMGESREAEQNGDSKLAEKLSDDAAFTAEMTPLEHNDENPFSKKDEPRLHRQFEKGSDSLFYLAELEKPVERVSREDVDRAIDRKNVELGAKIDEKEAGNLENAGIQIMGGSRKTDLSREELDQVIDDKNTELESKIEAKESENIKSDDVSEQIREQMKGDPSITPEDTKSELLADQAAQGKDEEEDERLRKKIEAERILAMTADAARASGTEVETKNQDNSLNVVPKGGELDRKDLVLPVAVERDFDEHEGKFFAKKTNRLMFEDKGDMIKTSTTDAKAIEAIVAYTKAKQWDSLKLSGSKEFRREVWLQAESQGIKTQGYTPKEADLAALSSLTNERATNTVTQLEPSKEKVKDEAKAPRHDLNKNQAVLHDEATKNLTANIKALNGSLDSTEISADEVSRLAYWRGVIIEENKHEPQGKRDEVLAKFDDMAKDPAFIDSLESKPREVVEEKYSERVQSHDEENEHSL
jgi:hypothetical protein